MKKYLIVTLLVLGILLIGCEKKAKDVSVAESPVENVESVQEYKITFTNGQEYKFEELFVAKGTEEVGEEEIIFSGSEDTEKMKMIIEELKDLEVADPGEMLDSLADEQSLILTFKRGDKEDKLFMYDSKPYVNTGLYHYSLYSDESFALLSQRDLIKSIIEIIEK